MRLPGTGDVPRQPPAIRRPGMNIRNLKIGVRLGAGFFIVLALLSAIAVMGLLKIGSTNQHVEFFAVNIVPSLKVVDRLRSSAQDLRRLESQHLLMSTEKEMDEVEVRIAATHSAVEAGVKTYETLVADAKDRSNLQAFQAAMKAYKAGWERLRVLSHQIPADPSKLEAAKALMFGESRQAFTEVTRSLDALWEYNDEMTAIGTKEAAAGYRSAIWLMVLLSLSAIAVGAIGALWITRSITQPMREAIQVADRIGAGDLSSRIEVGSQDETGQLLSAPHVLCV
eukprot:Opistho-2@61120